MNIWDFQTRLTRRLLIWSVLSVALSTLTFFFANQLLRGLAIQFFAWGMIDAGVALFGAYASAKKQAKLQSDELAETKEANWLERVLWINTAMDVLYILGGLWLMQTKGAESLLWRGHGLGVVIQGGFLFFFDFHHAFSLRKLQTT